MNSKQPQQGPVNEPEKTGDAKDTLSQQDLNGDDNQARTDVPKKALETPEGKNNGAEPAVFKNERKYRT